MLLMRQAGSSTVGRMEIGTLLPGPGLVEAQHLEAIFAAEYDLSPIGHLTLDRNGRVCWLNLAAARLLRGERFQFYHLPFLAFIEESYRRVFLDHLDTCIRMRPSVSSEVVLANHIKPSARVELRSAPGTDPSTGQVLCRTAIIDRSTQLRPDDRDLFDFVPDAILVHVNGRIVSANSGAAKLFRAKHPGQLLGLDILSLVHPQSRALVEERLERLAGFSFEGKSAGLGLGTVKYRAAVIHGTLEVCSLPGRGTIVTCSFPRSVAE
jgi:PAS domain-containing protein